MAKAEPSKHAPKYTRELADRVFVLLEEGQDFRTISALPGMPVATTFCLWKQEKPYFARGCARAQEAYLSRKAAQVVQEIAMHVALGCRIRDVCELPGMPPYNTLNDWLVQWPHLRRKLQQVRKMNLARMKESILDYLADGRSLRSICKLPDMPGRQTVRDWIAADPEFAEQFEQARRMGIDALADEVLDIADDTTLDLAERQMLADVRLRLMSHLTKTEKAPKKPAEPERDALAVVIARIRASKATL